MMTQGSLLTPPTSMAGLVAALGAAGQDFEWYPTTRRMVDAIRRDLGSYEVEHFASVMDIGAGDGRVLMQLAEGNETARLYSIEKAPMLQQRQPDRIIPVGCEFHEQNLMSLPVDVAFSNPPYSEFEDWAARVVSTVYAKRLYLVLPQRWEDSAAIAAALEKRDVKAEVIHKDDFLEADRRARAVVHVIKVNFEREREYYHYREKAPAQDPFDVWFDQNIDTFDRDAPIDDDTLRDQRLARLRVLDNIPALVEAFNEEYARMEEDYRAIFRLDAGLLKELGASKESLREGLKKRMAGLKHTYWEALFERLDVITARLTTKTKKGFLDRLTGQTAIAFTESNAYAVVLWAIKAANQYFDVQAVDVYRQLSTHDGVTNYASNQKTWVKDGWRYNAEEHSHYKLDYRIVLKHWKAMQGETGWDKWEYPGGLHNSCHEIIDDMIAVFGNLGFPVKSAVSSRARRWMRNDWQNFNGADGEVVFQVKAFLNGNLQLRIDQQAMKALNIEAGRLLGWLRSPADVVRETGYSAEDATRFFGSNQRLGSGNVRLLSAGRP